MARESYRSNGTAQAERHAEAARAKADERRSKASGASGWVADRAGQWSLDGPDEGFMRWQRFFWNALTDYWFRMEIEGWEELPEPPALLIGIHSGAPFVWDAWTVGLQWWRRFGDERPLHGTAHDALMATPLVRAHFRKMGVLPAAPGAAAAGQDPHRVPTRNRPRHGPGARGRRRVRRREVRAGPREHPTRHGRARAAAATAPIRLRGGRMRPPPGGACAAGTWVHAPRCLPGEPGPPKARPCMHRRVSA